MASPNFTEEEMRILMGNPHTLNVTPYRFVLTKEGKEGKHDCNNKSIVTLDCRFQLLFRLKPCASLVLLNWPVKRYYVVIEPGRGDCEP